MKKNFWDVSGDGKVDIVDIFWIMLLVISYGGGALFMFSTWGRSYHLLSSPVFAPKVAGGLLDWWPALTATSAEIGFLMAWLAGEVGFRKGKWQLVVISFMGMAIFGSVVGALQLYDSAYIEGKDLTNARDWAHTIASILPLFTIGYSAVVTMTLSAMSRWDVVNAGGQGSKNDKQRPEPRNDWTLNQPQPRQRQPEYSLPKSPRPNTFEQEESIFKTYGEPVSDPVLDIRKANHKAATELSESNRSNNRHDPK